jgi:translation initiation factor 2 subunit 3
MLEQAVGTKEMVKVQEVKNDEMLLLHVGPAITTGKVTSAKSRDAKVHLTRPVCAETGSRVALSRKIAGRWRLIGYGVTKQHGTTS